MERALGTTLRPAPAPGPASGLPSENRHVGTRARSPDWLPPDFELHISKARGVSEPMGGEKFQPKDWGDYDPRGRS